MKLSRYLVVLILLITLTYGCAHSQTVIQTPTITSEPKNDMNENSLPKGSQESGKNMKMIVTISDYEFSATLEENCGVDALKEVLSSQPISIVMSDYAGFEKVGSLGFGLPTEDNQMTTEPGDIVLYNGNQIVVFYGSNSWSYTKIAHIDDLTNWQLALGNQDVTIQLSLQ